MRGQGDVAFSANTSTDTAAFQRTSSRRQVLNRAVVVTTISPLVVGEAVVGHGLVLVTAIDDLATGRLLTFERKTQCHGNGNVSALTTDTK